MRDFLALEYTPFIWPFIIALGLIIFLGIYAIRRRQAATVMTFAWLTLALFIWTLAYTLELSSTTLAGKVLWAKMTYLGSTLSPVIWLILAFQVTKKPHWLTLPVRILLGGFVLVTLLVVFTNEFHQWFWTSTYLESISPELQSAAGLYTPVYTAGFYLLITGSVMLYFDYYRTTPTYYGRQALVMALGAFIPLAGWIGENLLGSDPLPKLDQVLLFFLLSGLFFAFAIFRYGTLDLIYIARDLIIKNINAGIIVLDNSERVVDLNHHAQTLLSDAKAQSIGQPLSAIFPDWADLTMTTDQEQELSLDKQGQSATFYVQISPIKGTRDTVVGHIIVLFDITARKRAEEAIEATNQELSQTNQELEIINQALFKSNIELEASNDELDAFAHTVAHDLKNPLALLIGYSEFLAESWMELPTEETDRIMGRINQTVRKMTSIINELLLLASVRQMDQIKTEPLNMARLVGEAQARLQTMVGQSEGDLIQPSSWPTARGYGPWVEEVWVNYISNALKYGGQPLRVELGATLQPDGMIRFWVKDNGPGLSKEDQAKLFTEFTRLHQTRAQGHGLGLSIARRIVEKLGGTVGVESTPGQGATFYFTLPGE